MKLLFPLLLAPVLSLAAVTGSVSLLDGTPIAGAVIKSLTDSVTTSATGSFALGRTSGISPRFAKSIPVTSHLTVENGRPRLSFAGMDIAGRTLNGVRYERTPGVAQAQSLKGSIGTRSTFSARSTGTPDTLKVYWKGKRLTVLPVTSDTTLTFRIDTAWKDDAGIPWNPSIAYGSLFDSRDGQTYRTVTIGSQTWMAENLNFKWGNSTDSACLEQNGIRLCHVSGYQFYSWSEAMGIDAIYDSLSWQGSSKRGICPLSWHVPSNEEWATLFPTDSIAVAIDSAGDTTALPMELSLTRPPHSIGFRISGEWIELDSVVNKIVYDVFRSSQQSTSPTLFPNQSFSGIQGIYSIHDTLENVDRVFVYRSRFGDKSFRASLRCLKD